MQHVCTLQCMLVKKILWSVLRCQIASCVRHNNANGLRKEVMRLLDLLIDPSIDLPQHPTVYVQTYAMIKRKWGSREVRLLSRFVANCHRNCKLRTAKAAYWILNLNLLELVYLGCRGRGVTLPGSVLFFRPVKNGNVIAEEIQWDYLITRRVRTLKIGLGRLVSNHRSLNLW